MESNYTRKKIYTFRERFCQLCDENPMSDIALAEKLHVSKQTISAWRNGTRSPKQPTIIAISNYFNVSVEWIMGFDVERREQNEEESHSPDPDVPKNDEIRFLVRGLNKLSPEQVEQARNVMKIMFAKYADYFDKENDDET